MTNRCAALTWMTVALLAPRLASAEQIRDLELGLKIEIPLVATHTITETAFGKGTGEGGIHLGGQAEAAWTLTETWLLTGSAGTRVQLASWPADDEGLQTPYSQLRTLRLLAGVKRSFTGPPTFPYLTGGLGYCSAAWVLDYGATSGDRISRGGAAYLGAGVDHFLTLHWGLSAELRAWGELYPGEQQEVDGWAFELNPGRVGVSLMAGALYR